MPRRCLILPRLFAHGLPLPQARVRGFPEAGRIDAAGGGGEHQGAEPCARPQRILDGGPATHRLGHNAHIGELKMVDKGGEIVGIVARVGPTVDARRRGKATVGEGHAGIACRKACHLLPPGGVIAAKAVRKDERPTLAGDFIVETAARPLEAAAPPLRHCVRLAHGRSEARLSCEGSSLKRSSTGVPVAPQANLETLTSLLVMNSSSAGCPFSVAAMPRLMAGTISLGFSTRSP